MADLEFKDRKSLLNFLVNRVSQRAKENKSDVELFKEINRINVHMGNVCASKCLNDFRTTSLSPSEEMCLTECSRKYFDLLEKGEKPYENVLIQSFKF